MAPGGLAPTMLLRSGVRVRVRVRVPVRVRVERPQGAGACVRTAGSGLGLARRGSTEFMKHVLPRFCSPAPRPTVAEAEEPPPFACGWPLAACCLPLLWECVLCAHAGRGPVRRAAEATGRGEAPGREKYELPIATMARRRARQSRTRAKVRFMGSNLWAPSKFGKGSLRNEPQYPTRGRFAVQQVGHLEVACKERSVRASLSLSLSSSPTY